MVKNGDLLTATLKGLSFVLDQEQNFFTSFVYTYDVELNVYLVSEGFSVET